MRIIPDYDHDFNISIVLIAFYGFMFLPQYVLNTDCEPEDDLNRSKHVVLYKKENLVVFGRISTCFLLQITQRDDIL
jgi:hypothetical protein